MKGLQKSSEICATLKSVASICDRLQVILAERHYKRCTIFTKAKNLEHRVISFKDLADARVQRARANEGVQAAEPFKGAVKLKKRRRPEFSLA